MVNRTQPPAPIAGRCGVDRERFLNMTEILPAIFFGHGNPMNAVLENDYTKAWSHIGRTIPIGMVELIEQRPKLLLSTNNAQTFGQELSRDVSHSPAIQQEPLRKRMEPRPAHTNEIVQASAFEARSVSRLCDRVTRRASPGLDTDLSGLGLAFLYPGNVRKRVLCNRAD